MLTGPAPKDADRKVSRTANTHEWIDVENVPYSGFVPNLPPGLPARTREVWQGITRMPHCALWSTDEWDYAVDTMILHAAFAAGDFRQAGEIRRRMMQMGVTADARRSLRIRYVDPQFTEGETTSPEIADIAIERKRRLAG